MSKTSKENNAGDLVGLASRAKRSSVELAMLSTLRKNAALEAMAAALRSQNAFVLAENAKDIAAARGKKLPSSMVARLALDPVKVGKIADSIASIAKLPDPVGRVISTVTRPNGLVIRKVGVPIGVILIIYESRPNVTADCMALCLKSGNSVILKGGSEALYSNEALFRVLNRAAVKAGVPEGAFEFVSTGGREAAKALLGLNEWIDLVIPRGGEGLIRDVAKSSKIPVIKHTKGVCHVYVDADADLEKSKAVVLNAKVQNPAVCNAMETLLVHEAAAKRFLPMVCQALKEKKVEIRGCEKSRRIVPGLKKAAEEDWYAEYLDLVLAVRVVKNLEEAVEHIRKYGSRHSDAIMTENKQAAEAFTRSVDSACVFTNCSTRFADGGEFGMGAEMGISTDKLHARGPMGLEELTSYKYVVVGNGQIRG